MSKGITKIRETFYKHYSIAVVLNAILKKLIVFLKLF